MYVNWPGLVKSFTIKQMRSLYAEIAYEVFAPKTFTKAAYFSQILGHATNDIKTSLSCMNYVLGRGKGNVEKARRIIQDAIDEANTLDTVQRAEKDGKEPGAGAVIDEDD